MKKVMILFGGESEEHDVSLKSAASILANMDVKKFAVTMIYIDRKGTWYQYLGKSLEPFLENQLEPIENVVAFLKQADFILPMIHGAFGEDGRLQGFLELFHLPYLGCTSKTSMLCMDKEYTKMIARQKEIPILPFQVIEKIEDMKMEFPVVIKPASQGSSIGVSFVPSKKEFKKCYQEAKKYDSKVLVEKYLEGRELEVGVLLGKKTIFSPIGEILKQDTLYSFDRKYIHSEEGRVANLPKEIETRILKLAKKLVQVFSLRGFARIDFFYDEKNNQVYFNEINTIPGFTSISMYPTLFLKMGYSYSKLLSSLLETF